MKLREHNERWEGRVLAGMILNPNVVGRLADVWGDGDRFSSTWANIVGRWAVEHHRRHGGCLGKGVTTAYEEWSADQRARSDDETPQLVEKFLRSVSDEHSSDDINESQIVDVALRRFRDTSLRKMAEGVLADLDARRGDKAEERAAKYSRIEATDVQGVHLLTDPAAMRSSLTPQVREDLFEYRGDLGRFYRNSLHRNSLVAFTAPQKTGKTMWLVDFAWQAMSCRQKVAYFSIGDLSDWEVDELILARIARKPVRSDEGWPLKIDWPLSIRWDRGWEVGKRVAELETERRIFKGPLTPDEGVEAAERFMRKVVRSEASHFQRSCHANLSITVEGIRSILDRWELKGYCPSTVIIDYADNLKPIDSRDDARNQVNVTWKKLKALAQDRRCLVVTATQVNAAGFKTFWLDKTNFSEDNRKLSHVDLLVGINQLPDEKDMQICRLNAIVKRKGRFSTRNGPHCAGCLAVANPAIVSTFPFRRERKGNED